MANTTNFVLRCVQKFWSDYLNLVIFGDVRVKYSAKKSIFRPNFEVGSKFLNAMYFSPWPSSEQHSQSIAQSVNSNQTRLALNAAQVTTTTPPLKQTALTNARQALGQPLAPQLAPRVPKVQEVDEL